MLVISRAENSLEAMPSSSIAALIDTLPPVQPGPAGWCTAPRAGVGSLPLTLVGSRCHPGADWWTALLVDSVGDGHRLLGHLKPFAEDPGEALQQRTGQGPQGAVEVLDGLGIESPVTGISRD